LTVGHHHTSQGAERLARCVGGGASCSHTAAHPAANGGHGLVETLIGIALIVISALETWFIVKTVQSNMGRP